MNPFSIFDLGFSIYERLVVRGFASTFDPVPNILSPVTQWL